MIHPFRFADDYLIFEADCGALYQLTEPAYHLVLAYAEQGGTRPAPERMARLSGAGSAQDLQTLNDIADQLDQLIAERQLFVTAPQVERHQLYPDEPRLKAMCLHLCHDCNLRCAYCFAGTGDFGSGVRSYLSVETGRRAVDFLIEASGPRHHLDIDFFGGEPLLNWDVLVELVTYCERRGEETGKDLRLTLTTNALLLDAEKTAFINQHFKNVVLSIDGREGVHNRMRPDAGGKGSYQRVAERIRAFVAARGGQEYYLRGTFTRHNLDFADDVLHLAELGQHVSVEPVVAPPGSGYEIRPEDLPAIEAEYERLALLLDARAAQGEAINFFHFNIDLGRGACAFKRLKGCGVGAEYCAVTPDGTIFPCHQLAGEPAFALGSVLTSPTALDVEKQRPFLNLLLPDKAACRDCWARFYCGGGCAANSYHAAGSLDGTDTIGCRLLKKRLECALWLTARKRNRSV